MQQKMSKLRNKSFSAPLNADAAKWPKNERMNEEDGRRRKNCSENSRREPSADACIAAAADQMAIPCGEHGVMD